MTAAVLAAVPGASSSPAGDVSYTIACGTRSVFVEVAGEIALIAPAIGGTTIADRIAQRSAKLDVVSYGLTATAADAAATGIARHLRG